MKRNLFRSIKISCAILIAGVAVAAFPVNVKADAAADALLAQQAALAAQAQQQALLLQAQQQQQAALLAQLQAQQQALLLQAQQQQQALLAQQYQAAVQVQNNFTNQHLDAAQQAFLLQQTQNAQLQQYQAMINRCNLDYKSDLMDTYQKYQNAALKSFLGYNGY